MESCSGLVGGAAARRAAGSGYGGVELAVTVSLNIAPMFGTNTSGGCMNVVVPD
ncbi:MAG TPA: hypothetical protein VKV28_07545 [Candidatus Binataceae bacterium]|nr:hypothetical protein [Candidatus Binataceae bacterium]